MPFIKLNQPKYLSDQQYLISDTDPDSEYFNVTEVPDILHGGKNLFMIKGNKSLLAPGSTIEIEVTDLNGRAIYHENANYIEPGTKRRAVAIYVYEHTPQGGGVITITGTAQKRPNGKSVSLELQKTPNVIWQKKINVLPKNENTTRVILNRTPVVQIKEVIKEYFTPSGGLLSGSQTILTFGGGGMISYDRDSMTLNTTASFFVQNMEGQDVNFYGIMDAHVNHQFLYIPPTPPAFPYGQMVNPHLTTEPSSWNGTYNMSTNKCTIEEVVNSTTAKVVESGKWMTSTEYDVPAQGGGGGTAAYTEVDPFAYPKGFNEGPDFTLTYQTEPIWASSTLNSESWAKVDIAELDPICGDIKRLVAYKKSQGIQQWSYIAEVVLENQELLANDTYQGLNQFLGQFRSQDIIDNYWEASYGGFSGAAIGSDPQALSDPSIFINGTIISGSELLTGVTTNETRLDAYAEFRTTASADWNNDGINTNGLALKADTSYILTMKLAGQGVNDGVSKPVIKIFASGSAIDLPSEDSTMRKFATIQANSTYVGPPFNSSDPPYLIPEEDSTFHFDVSTAGNMAIIFRIVSGRWWISDVSLKPASQTGFTPNFTSLEFAVPQIAQQNDVVDFKFELYDNLDNLVHTETTQSLAWSGGNFSLNGDNNFLGDGIVLDGG